MTEEKLQITYTAEKFQNAEHLWFWFLYAKSIKSGFLNTRYSYYTRRICEVLDVEILVTKLYLSGAITEEQLVIMKKFGDKRRAPHQYIWEENRFANLWTQAMKVLQKAAQKRGWIE